MGAFSVATPTVQAATSSIMAPDEGPAGICICLGRAEGPRDFAARRVPNCRGGNGAILVLVSTQVSAGCAFQSTPGLPGMDGLAAQARAWKAGAQPWVDGGGF